MTSSGSSIVEELCVVTVLVGTQRVRTREEGLEDYHRFCYRYYYHYLRI